jgi:tetratricopeptide (TPR) repeat protein
LGLGSILGRGLVLALLAFSAPIAVGLAHGQTPLQSTERALWISLEELEDPDAAVRGAALEALGRPELAGMLDRERALALAGVARDDARQGLRLQAIGALTSLGAQHGGTALARLVTELPMGEAVVSARKLITCVGTPQELSALLDPLVRAGLGSPAEAAARDREQAETEQLPEESETASATLPGARHTPPEVLAVLLPTWAQLLADRPTGGLTARERAPLVAATLHPHPMVRRAADRAFQGLVSRFMGRGEARRGLEVLTALGRQGLDTRMTAYHGARLALVGGLDPREVRAAARRCGGPGHTVARSGPVAGPGEAPGADRLWTFRALYLEGMGELAGGEARRARDLFQDSAAVLARLLASREDLGEGGPAPGFEEALHHRSLAHLATVLAMLVEGVPPTHGSLVMQAREAHFFSLLYQAQSTRSGGSSGQGWDAILTHELSPLRLLVPRERGLWSARQLRERSLELGTVLACVHPLEMPGFVPATDAIARSRTRPLARENAEAGSGEGTEENPIMDPVVDPIRDPLQDAQRVHVFQDIVQAEIEQLQALVVSIWERQRLNTEGGAPSAAEQQRLAQARARLDERLRTDLLGPENAPDDFRKLRVPSSLALRLARDLRAAGELDRARGVVRALSDDLAASGHHREMLWGLELEAEVDLVEGAILSDAGEPEEAELFLERAVERLEGLEQLLIERSAGSPRMLAGLRDRRCDALVSLAVNANVVLGQPERALAYFERAHALRQDDFTNVLLACYRARSGRAAEARQILDALRPSPATYYNLACTWALLGDRERALFFLERDLAENHGGPAARNRQRDWARRDPDLASLWGAVRFEEVLLTE